MPAPLPAGTRIVVHVYGWQPGEHLEMFETDNLTRAQGFARRWTKPLPRGGGAAFATLHVDGDPRVSLYARGRLSRRLAPRTPA